MKNKIKRIVTVIVICLFAAGLFACTKDKTEEQPTEAPTATATPTEVVTATPVPTQEPTPEPTAEPTPEPTPTPLPTARDTFETTGFSGGYYTVLPETEWSYGEVMEVGGRIIAITTAFGMPHAMFSIDPATGEVIKADLSEMYCYSSFYRINDELFALKNDFGGDGYYEEGDEESYDYDFGWGSCYTIYDKYLRTIYTFKGQDTYENVYFSPDGENMWRFRYNDESVKKYNYRTGETTAVEELNQYIDNESNHDLIVCTLWNDYDGLEGRLIYDAKNGKILAKTDENNVFWIEASDDDTQCAVIRTVPSDSITIYNCSARDLLDENGEFVGEEAAVIELSDHTETNNPKFDWKNGYVFTTIDSWLRGISYHNYNCYSMKTGELVSDYDVRSLSDQSGGSFAIDQENGLAYIISSDENDKSLEIVAWDYVNDDAADTLGIYDKQTIIPNYILEKRAAFEEKHGFLLYLGSEVFAADYSYRLSLCTDWETISNTIDVLDEVLDIYPEGFFEQIRSGKIKTLAIYLCSGFTKVADNSADNAIALATSFGYEQALAIDVNYRYCLERTIVHEISHWIDSKIERAGDMGIYSEYEDEWLTYQPSDFTYKYSYVSGKTVWKYIYGYSDDNSKAYFTDDYSQTYPGEDRARCFEYLMYPDYTAYMESPLIREKLRFYFSVIRQVFDSSDWPEETAWEQKLREADEGNTKNDEGGNVAETDIEGQG